MKILSWVHLGCDIMYHCGKLPVFQRSEMLVFYHIPPQYHNQKDHDLKVQEM